LHFISRLNFFGGGNSFPCAVQFSEASVIAFPEAFVVEEVRRESAEHPVRVHVAPLGFPAVELEMLEFAFLHFVLARVTRDHVQVHLNRLHLLQFVHVVLGAVSVFEFLFVNFNAFHQIHLFNIQLRLKVRLYFRLNILD